jgi:NADPH:quinone reductase-like Zn-dependent oxidoreductase
MFILRNFQTALTTRLTFTRTIASHRTAAMSTKAITYVEKGKAAIQDVPMPKLRDDYILVKVKAVAVNPTDWKHVDFGVADAGARLGNDYAGIVQAVGSKVQKRFEKGDRITGVAHGGYVYLKAMSPSTFRSFR